MMGGSFGLAQRNERGGVLVLALVAVTAVAALSMTFFQLSSSVTRSQRQAVDRKQAFYLAEAGLAEAFAALRVGKTGNVGSEDVPALMGAGLLWVEASMLETGDTLLASTGMAGGSRVLLNLVVAQPAINVGALGIFSDNALTLPAGSSVLGMDSDAPTESGESQAGAMIGSNGSITLLSEGHSVCAVEGDVLPGPGHSVLLGEGSSISGSRDARSTGITLPELAVPELELGAEVDWVSPVPLVVPPGSYGYAALRAHELTDIELQGPLTLVLGELSLADSAILTLDTSGGAIEIHTTDTIVLAAGSEIVVEGDDPADVLLHLSADQGLGTDPLADFAASSEFCGRVYAPRADVQLGGAFAVHGSLVARTLLADEPLSLTTDLALIEAGGLAELTGRSWRIVEMPDVAGGRGGSNPFAILSVDPSSLPLPADAHEDQTIQVSYTDSDGLDKEYDGPESSFDWADVSAWGQLQRRRRGDFVDLGTPPDFSADRAEDISMHRGNHGFRGYRGYRGDRGDRSARGARDDRDDRGARGARGDRSARDYRRIRDDHSYRSHRDERNGPGHRGYRAYRDDD